MKIIVIGGSRGIGLQTVKAALASGHKVSAFSRNPQQIEFNNKNLTKIKGDALNLEDIKKAVVGHDVVVCTLGLSNKLAIGPPFAKRSYVLSKGTSNIIAAMQDANIKRLVCVTAIGTGDSKSSCTILMRFTLRVVLHRLFHEKDKQEELIKATKLDWTIVRPTGLTNGKSKQDKVIRQVESGLFTHISRADVASSMLKMIENHEDVKKTVVISYKARFGDTARWVLGYFGVG